MTMTIQDLGALGELLGSIAVLVTLVYLALQMRQNTMMIGAQLDAARLTTVVDLNLAAATSKELQDSLAEAGDDGLWGAIHPRQHYWAAWLNSFQWQFVQARRGVLPSYHEPGVVFAVQGMFGSPGFGDYWDQIGRSGFRPEFVEFVEKQRSKAA